MLTIKVNNMKFHAHIGVYPEEKKIGQNIEVDLELVMRSDQAKNSDDLHDTISYGDVYRMTAAVVAKSRADLVERLAQEILDAIRSEYGLAIDQYAINIRKLAVPVDGIFDSVEISLTM
ncbi:dihydroneopterin aldolase [Leuconostocaceae bacterium ESL0723]|nr:dihydroneopterin aldolase [Leuconostocaceae bacterium ESL0723]